MRKPAKKSAFGFTLAELIVVIAIIAVLATIGFLSLSWYREDANGARNATNARSVYSAIVAESASRSVSARCFILHDSNYSLTWGAVIVFDGNKSSNLVGGGCDDPGTNYSVGNPDYVKLRLDKEKFRISQLRSRLVSIAERVLPSFAVAAGTDTNSLLVGAVDVTDGERPRSFVQIAAATEESVEISWDFPVSSVTEWSVEWLIRNLSSSSSTGALVQGSATQWPQWCEAQTLSWYSIPELASGDEIWVIKDIPNGKSNASAKCSFWTVTLTESSPSCDTDYVPGNPSPSCVLDTCSGTFPDHAVSNGPGWTAWWHYSTNSGTCAFACESGYEWIGGACRATCDVPPLDSFWWFAYSFGAWATVSHGQSVTKTGSYQFGVSPENGTLSAQFQYECSDGTLSKNVTVGTATCWTHYSWNSNASSPACVADTKTFSCAAKPATGTDWNTVPSYVQTWNGAAWIPADSTTSYDTAASSSACRYKCSSGYGWSGSACQASVNWSCWTANKAYAYSASSFGTDTFCGNGTPSVTPAFPAAWASVTWTCSWTYGGNQSPTCTASRNALVLANTWTATAGGPGARMSHSWHWTGSELLIWGGYDGGTTYYTNWYRFNPSTNAWTAISTTGAPAGRYSHQSVWTGNQLIVWSGFNSSWNLHSTWWKYTLSTNAWTAISTTGAPATRANWTAVWTGNEMIVWGGIGQSSALNTWGRYNPATDTWTAVSTTGAPSARFGHSAIWTGTEMIIWGGLAYDYTTSFSNWAKYNPTTNTWTPISTIWAPSARSSHATVWNGTEMIVWGGNTSINGWFLNTGGRYNPSTNTWTAMTTTGAPVARDGAIGVWTGTEMIVWGGGNIVIMVWWGPFNTWGRYNPSTNTWTAMTTTGAPVARYAHTMVWTGNEAIVWGGQNASYVWVGTWWMYR